MFGASSELASVMEFGFNSFYGEQRSPVTPGRITQYTYEESACVPSILQGQQTAKESQGPFVNVQSFVQSLALNYNELECGPMPNVMAALPNIGGAVCSTPQSLADAHY